jgi:hypothetical protein
LRLFLQLGVNLEANSLLQVSSVFQKFSSNDVGMSTNRSWIEKWNELAFDRTSVPTWKCEYLSNFVVREIIHALDLFNKNPLTSDNDPPR